MYIMKNALRNIVRNRGKNILLGLIALIIGLSSCLALSIRQAANKEKEEGLEALHITATISVDRMAMMQQAKPSQGSSDETDLPDRKEMFSNISSLSLEELTAYAQAASVQDFYYTDTVALNGSGVDAITTSDSTAEGGKSMPQSFGSQSDFNLIGYSTLDAMTAFTDGTASISEGEVFQETDTTTCIINEELAEYNDLQVGDQITLSNPNKEAETYALTITGLYTTSETQAAGSMGGRGMSMMDPANQIYTSAAAISSILSASEETNAASTDQALASNVNGTYVFENVAAYEAFEEEAYALGLSDEYTVSSQDVTAYENSLAPLENLSSYAMLFLAVVLVIGGVVLVVLHMYHIRERKYEIGVLAAIGMNKRRIGAQFISEIFVVTMIAVLLGTGLGACISVPVTNSLLSSTASSLSTSVPGRDGFGRMEESEQPADKMGFAQQYLQEVSSATDVMVVLQVCGVALLLVVLSSGIAVMSILRYEPLKILSNRE